MSDGFDVVDYIAEKVWDPRLMADPRGRKILTKHDPLLFALFYLPHHLKSEETGNKITLAQIHINWCNMAKEWSKALDTGRGPRDAYIAPRSTGKSTWMFLIFPLWAAAHRHIKFMAAFSDSSTQAETHLSTFKHELDTNESLKRDFPMLCKMAYRPKGAVVADNRSLMTTSSGFTFAAKGIDGSTLGLKVGADRPDVILLDDIEPGESQYSVYQLEKRLRTIQDVILPLRESARVIMTGTTTMRGSLIDQLVRSVTTTEVAGWINDDGFKAHYFPAIITREDGTEYSIWPERWPMAYLNEMRNTRSFQKNFQNMPLGDEAAYWSAEDFKYGSLIAPTLKIMCIDPAVTTKRSSDRTGISIVQWSDSERKFEVIEATGVRLRGDELRTAVLGILSRHSDVKRVMVEANQGGEMWHAVLHHMPAKVLTFSVSEKKEIRASRLLNHYQRGRVLHTQQHALLEGEMVEFPMGLHDDMIDSVGGAIDYLVSKTRRQQQPGIRNTKYV